MQQLKPRNTVLSHTRDRENRRKKNPPNSTLTLPIYRTTVFDGTTSTSRKQRTPVFTSAAARTRSARSFAYRHTHTHEMRGEEWEVPHLRGRVDPVASSLSSRTEEGQRSRFMFLFLTVRRCAGWVLLVCVWCYLLARIEHSHTCQMFVCYTHTLMIHTHINRSRSRARISKMKKRAVRNDVSPPAGPRRVCLLRLARTFTGD